MNIIPQNTKVALLVGGTSGEREISLASGRGAQAALEEAGFDVEVIDTASKEDIERLVVGKYDVAFICLHGKMGEDGTIQGMLEILDIPYTGSGVLSSAVAMDKTKAKLFYQAEGIPTPQSVSITRGEEIDWGFLAETVSYPCVVKPSTEGSALGVYICQDKEELAVSLTDAFKVGPELLVEDFIAGTELTVAVIGNEEPIALPIIEIIPIMGEFYDYQAKYAKGGSRHICPARLDQETSDKVKELALKAHVALGCRGMSRTDMILDEKGGLFVLETNTIPGMTETSLLPDAARAAGMSFAELCTKLIEFALE